MTDSLWVRDRGKQLSTPYNTVKADHGVGTLGPQNPCPPPLPWGLSTSLKADRWRHSVVETQQYLLVWSHSLLFSSLLLPAIM